GRGLRQEDRRADHREVGDDGRPDHPALAVTDAEALLLVVAAVYLSECLSWVRRDAVVFRALFGRSYRALGGRSLAGNDRSGLALAQPFPPLGRRLVAAPLPVAMGTDAVLGSPSTGASAPPLVAWADVGEPAAVESDLHVNGRLLARTGSPLAARELGRLLAAIARHPREKRE